MVARDSLCSPLGVAVRKRLNIPAMRRDAAIDSLNLFWGSRSFLPGYAQMPTRNPGRRRTRIRARRDREFCRACGERWTKARAVAAINIGAIRCHGGGHASLISASYALVYSGPCSVYGDFLPGLKSGVFRPSPHPIRIKLFHWMANSLTSGRSSAQCPQDSDRLRQRLSG